MRAWPGVSKLAATIDRRLLVNYRVDPGVVGPWLPHGLRPHLVDGSAVAGICLLRLTQVWPSPLRPGFGWGAENVAHRIAVTWEEPDGRTAHGVYIPRRHSASPLTVLAGGRVFPGVHQRASFHVEETADSIQLEVTAPDMTVGVDVSIPSQSADAPTAWSSSLFPTVDAASEFFRGGAVGWSPSRSGETLQGLRLDTDAWRVEVGDANEVRSSFFDDLPRGSAELDNTLVMRGVPVTWSIAGERASAAIGDVA